MKRGPGRGLLLALAFLGGGFWQARGGDITVFATASSTSNSIFGTLDLTTGQFTEIDSLSEHIQSLTAGPGGLLYGSDENTGDLYSITTTGVAKPYGSIIMFGALWGLAYAGSSTGFYGIHVYSTEDYFVKIAPDGNHIITPFNLPNTSVYDSGSLAYGPDGKLYLDSVGSTAQLYEVNLATNTLTAVGTGLGLPGTHSLTLGTANGQLYGVDTIQAAGGSSPIDIYTVNTTTGAATATGVHVTGLSSGYTIDTIAALSVPEPGTLTLGLIGSLFGLIAVRRARRA
ncbi:MAG: PEP-CTERM sorting domain-containing protein [Isosphaeraceae bacterium]